MAEVAFEEMIAKVPVTTEMIEMIMMGKMKMVAVEEIAMMAKGTLMTDAEMSIGNLSRNVLNPGGVGISPFLRSFDRKRLPPFMGKGMKEYRGRYNFKDLSIPRAEGEDYGYGV